MSSSSYNINNGGDYYHPLSSPNLNSTSAIPAAAAMEYSTMSSSSPGSMSSSPAYPAAYQAPSSCYVAADPNQLYYQHQLAHNGNDMLVQAHAQAYQAQCFAWFQQQYTNIQLSPSSFPHPMMAHTGFIPPPPSFLHQHQHPRASSEKRRGARTPFSDSQLYALRTRFEQCDTIKVDERRKLGAVIGLSPEQIKIWFQNRRFKLRKEKDKKIKDAVQQQQKSAKEEEEEDQKHVIS